MTIKFKEGQLLKDVQMPRTGEKSQWLKDLETKQAEQRSRVPSEPFQLFDDQPVIELSLVPDEPVRIQESNVIQFYERSKVTK